MYFIWSNEHKGWWGPNHCGYAKRLSDAGQYSRAEALAICQRALGTALHIGMFAEIPVRVEDVREFLKGAILPEGLV